MGAAQKNWPRAATLVNPALSQNTMTDTF
jgi:hypothetical protein